MGDRSALCTVVIAVPAALFYLVWSVVALVRPAKAPYAGFSFSGRIESTPGRIRAYAVSHLFAALVLVLVAVLAWRAWQG